MLFDLARVAVLILISTCFVFRLFYLSCVCALYVSCVLCVASCVFRVFGYFGTARFGNCFQRLVHAYLQRKRASILSECQRTQAQGPMDWGRFLFTFKLTRRARKYNSHTRQMLNNNQNLQKLGRIRQKKQRGRRGEEGAAGEAGEGGG